MSIESLQADVAARDASIVGLVDAVHVYESKVAQLESDLQTAKAEVETALASFARVQEQAIAADAKAAQALELVAKYKSIVAQLTNLPIEVLK